jgi:hypothetical protein
MQAVLCYCTHLVSVPCQGCRINSRRSRDTPTLRSSPLLAHPRMNAAFLITPTQHSTSRYRARTCRGGSVKSLPWTRNQSACLLNKHIESFIVEPRRYAYARPCHWCCAAAAADRVAMILEGQDPLYFRPGRGWDAILLFPAWSWGSSQCADGRRQR